MVENDQTRNYLIYNESVFLEARQNIRMYQGGAKRVKTRDYRSIRQFTAIVHSKWSKNAGL
jgi:hypothetical protein